MANETGIVGNPYTGGNVPLNLTPFTQFYVNILARQQAKEEAAAKEYQAQAKLLTPAGMRGQDVNALMSAKNEWQADWYKNKDKILHADRDNGEAWNKNNELFNKANNIPTVSKDLVKGNQFISKILSDPTKSRLLTDDAIERIRLHNLPLNDPNHKSITDAELESPLFNPKPLTPSEDIALTNLVNTKFKGEKVKSMPGTTDQSTFKREDVNTYAPKKSELPEYLDMGERLYRNGQLAGEVNKIIADHAHGVINPVYDNLNTTYKSLYGKDIEHPEEAATALLINKNLNYGDKKESVTDISAQKAADEAARLRAYNKAELDRRERQRRSFEHQDKLVGTGQTQGNLFDAFGDVQELDSKKGTGLKIKSGLFTDKEGNGYNGSVFMPKELIPVNIYNALKASGVDANKLKFNNGFEVIVKDGRVQGLKDKDIGLVDRQGIENAQLKFNTEPQKGKQMQFGKQTPNANGYSNVTETNKGTIGVKNGKWYDIKTGKPI